MCFATMAVVSAVTAAASVGVGLYGISQQNKALSTEQKALNTQQQGASTILEGGQIQSEAAGQQYDATTQNALYQAQVATNNATIANQNADYTMAAGQEQTTVEGMKNRTQFGGVKSGQAANNIDVNTGSAVKVQQGTRQVGELDAQTTLSNAQQVAYGYRTTAANETAQSGLYTQQAQQSANAKPIAQQAPLVAAQGGYLTAEGQIQAGEGQIQNTQGQQISEAGGLLGQASGIGFKWGGGGTSTDPANSASWQTGTYPA